MPFKNFIDYLALERKYSSHTVKAYKNDLEKYADIDNFFDRVEGGLKKCGLFLNITYTLTNTMKHSELLEMLLKEFGEANTLLTYGLGDRQMDDDDPDYHNEVSEIFFQYNKRGGGSMYYFSLEEFKKNTNIIWTYFILI